MISELRRRCATSSSAVGALRDAGLWIEALILESHGLLAWSAHQVCRQRVLTAEDDGYPSRWTAILGTSAPLAFWRRGAITSGPPVTIVGSRSAPLEALEFASEAARRVVSAGSVVWSGGAEGCDQAALASAGTHAVSILPFGILRARKAPCALLSLSAPSDEFSAASAMQRNDLLYSVAPLTVVAHARFREGGTWHAAVEALRRRRTRIAILDDRSPAVRALVSLGAVPVRAVEELGDVLKRAPMQPGLFQNAG